MNRYDEIRAAAGAFLGRLVPENQREDATDELLKLICLVVESVGKSVAVDGESAICFDEDDAEQNHTIYLTGERIQDGARHTLNATTEGNRP